MMDALRRGAGTWVAKIFLMLLVLSFAVWGIADIFTGYRGDALVTIGKTEVSGERYRYELQTEMQNFGRTIGRPLTLQEARAFGIDAQVLGRLITEASLDEKARIMGLNVSDAGIAGPFPRTRSSRPRRGSSIAATSSRFCAPAAQRGRLRGREAP